MDFLKEAVVNPHVNGYAYFFYTHIHEVRNLSNGSD